MRVLYRAAALFRALFQHEHVDADIADELRFHIERETEANIARGMQPDVARRTARLKVGSVDDALETARDDRPGNIVHQFVGDVRHGTRLLAKSPAFALAATAIIALGIGAVTAVFSVVYSVMLNPLPYHAPDRLVNIWTTSLSADGARLYPTAADAADWRGSSRTLEDIALARTSAQNLNLVGTGEPERLQAARVTTNLFTVLGAAPAIGRAFAKEESVDGRDHVIILSDGLWRTHFGGDPKVVGHTVPLNGAA